MMQIHYLNIILDPGPHTAAERVGFGQCSAQLAFLAPLDNMEGLGRLAAVLIKQNSTGSGDFALEETFHNT